jgi:hypothetical protein
MVDIEELLVMELTEMLTFEILDDEIDDDETLLVELELHGMVDDEL